MARKQPTKEEKDRAVTLALELVALIADSNPTLQGTRLDRDAVAEVLEAHLANRIES